MVIPSRSSASSRNQQEQARQPRERKKWAIVIAKGCKRVGGAWRTNRRIRVPAIMWPCTIEEKLTMKNVDGKMVEDYETKVIHNQGFITRYHEKRPEFTEEGGVVKARSRDLYAFVDRVSEEERNRRSDFASRLLPQPEGNRNGWISAEEEEEEEEEEPKEEYEGDSDLESTTSSKFNPAQD